MAVLPCTPFVGTGVFPSLSFGRLPKPNSSCQRRYADGVRVDLGMPCGFIPETELGFAGVLTEAGHSAARYHTKTDDDNRRCRSPSCRILNARRAASAQSWRPWAALSEVH
jgi:hypothetical protein